MQLDTLSKADAEFARTRYAVPQTETDRYILRVAEAVLDGKSILSLRHVVQTGGRHGGSHLPKLAVARLSWAKVHFNNGFGEVRPNGKELFPPPLLPNIGSSLYGGQAVVPIVPPALRPTTDPDSHVVLWEAEWTNLYPRDPALLRQFEGDLYELVGTWDLTELERSVLDGWVPAPDPVMPVPSLAAPVDSDSSIGTALTGIISVTTSATAPPWPFSLFSR